MRYGAFPKRVVAKESVEQVLERWGKPDAWDEWKEWKKRQWLVSRVDVAIPNGWEDWDYYQQRQFLERQVKRRKALAKKLELVHKRSENESFRFRQLPDYSGVPFPETPEGYTAPIGKPKFVIRAVYGPAMGLPMSRLLGLLYDERYLTLRVPGGIKQYESDPNYGKIIGTFEEMEQAGPSGIRKEVSDVVDTVADGFDPSGGGRTWGPREFLWQLFDMVARCDGDCEIFFVHNQVRMEVDKEAFKEWMRRSEEDPITALLEPLKLLPNPE